MGHVLGRPSYTPVYRRSDNTIIKDDKDDEIDLKSHIEKLSQKTYILLKLSKFSLEHKLTETNNPPRRFQPAWIKT